MSPIVSLPWYRLSGEAFESLCYELLSRLGYGEVEWFRGPGDRGRDILAARNTSTSRRQKWVVECKRLKRTVSIEDLGRTVYWMDAREDYGGLLIMTSSHLRTDTRDWIARLNSRRKTHYRIEYMEAHELFQHLLRHKDLLFRYFPNMKGRLASTAMALEAYLRALMEIWRANYKPEPARILASRAAYRKLKRTTGQIDDPYVAVIMLLDARLQDPVS